MGWIGVTPPDACCIGQDDLYVEDGKIIDPRDLFWTASKVRTRSLGRDSPPPRPRERHRTPSAFQQFWQHETDFLTHTVDIRPQVGQG
eukprot:SAG11_NODE_14377_length_614_cov_1.205825_1_plen_87_part_10